MGKQPSQAKNEKNVSSVFADLLSSDSSRAEREIETMLVRLLRKWGIGEIKQDHSRNAGFADIYLPRRRVFIEVKRVGGASNPHSRSGEDSDSPFEQVQRYVSAEKDYELARLPDLSPERSWFGIVTDGQIWHAWAFPHEVAALPHSTVIDSVTPSTEAELYQLIFPLLTNEPIGKPHIPQNPVDIFKDYLTELFDIHVSIASSQHSSYTTETKKQLWLDMLRGSGMTPNAANETRLFVAHCFLVTLARGVEHTLTSQDTPPDAQKCVGSGFMGWVLNSAQGRQWAQRLLERVHSFEWRLTPGDVLRPLYEQFVDAQDRKDFGEVYTPDWLAEMMVEEVLDDAWCQSSVNAALAHIHNRETPLEGVGVLDPTCGSGTFLYHSAQRLLTSQAMDSLSSHQKAEVVCLLVNGIDIHPVAVEFSRATLLRALPSPPTSGRQALRVYQGDSLMQRQTDENTLFQPTHGELLIRSPGQREIRIPRAFTEHKDFQGMLARIVEAAAAKQSLPTDIAHQVAANDLEAVDACHQALTKVIEAEGNSVWTWFITNLIGAEQLSRRKVNRIVANPPWVKISDIRGDRKKALEALAGKNKRLIGLDLWTGGKQAPHFDIAQLFIHQARSKYLANLGKDPAAWVTKASAIRGGNWQKFRDYHNTVFAQALDFSDVEVFGGGDARRSCVLYEIRKPLDLPQPATTATSKKTSANKVLIMSCIGDNKPQAHITWAEAQALLQWEFEVLFPQSESAYHADTWRQGATITPKVLSIAEQIVAAKTSGRSLVTTVPSDRQPWQSMPPQTGEVPDHWLLPLLQSQQLRPFSAAPRIQAIVPCDIRGRLLTLERAREEEFWVQLEDLYEEGRGEGQSTPQTLLARINHINNLSVQLPLRPASKSWAVVYPASGDIMRAARFKARTAVMDAKIYRRTVSSAAEAHYLIAILNAPCLEEAFRQSRTSGRDFHKNPWRSIPIPLYSHSNTVHTQLAALAAQAEQTVAVMNIPPQTGQIAASKQIRQHLTSAGILHEIDQRVRILLPDHTN